MCGLVLRAIALLPEGDPQRLELMVGLAVPFNDAGLPDEARAVAAELLASPEERFQAFGRLAERLQRRIRQRLQRRPQRGQPRCSAGGLRASGRRARVGVGLPRRVGPALDRPAAPPRRVPPRNAQRPTHEPRVTSRWLSRCGRRRRRCRPTARFTSTKRCFQLARCWPRRRNCGSGERAAAHRETPCNAG